MRRSPPVILQAAHVAVTGTQGVSLVDGPLQADKAGTSTLVHQWTVGEQSLLGWWDVLLKDAALLVLGSNAGPVLHDL